MFKILKVNYCLTTLKLCNKLISTKCKLKRNELLINFLKECLNKFVYLKWIVARIYKSKLKYGYKVEKMFLKLEMSKIEGRLIDLKDSVVRIENSLKIKFKKYTLMNLLITLKILLKSNKKSIKQRIKRT